jgi:hypothetical protein
MSTLLAIVDVIVLVLLVVHVLGRVKKESPQGSGSMLLTICVAVVAIVFAIISFAAYLGLVAASSTMTQVIFLIVLLAMAGILLTSFSSKPVA